MTIAEDKVPELMYTPGEMHRGMDLVDLYRRLMAQKTKLVVIPVTCAIAAFSLSYLIPPSFKADTKLLPPQQAQSGTAALLSQLGGGMGAVASSAAGLKNPNDVYLAILKSRIVGDRIIAKFDLRKSYGTPSMEKARKTLAERTNIVSGKDGLIQIEVEDTQKDRVALIANAYVSEFFTLTKSLAVTEAGQRRLFFETQLGQAKERLVLIESKLKNSLGEHGVISVDSNSRTIVETAARLRARISAKEVELNSIRAFVTPSNQEFKEIQQELASLKGELSRLENGSPMPGSSSADDAKNRMGLENIQLVRDLKYQQTLYELLAKQYEAARLDEAKNAAVLQVLDVAVEPEGKSKPARAKIAIMALAVSGIVTMMWILLKSFSLNGYATPTGSYQTGRQSAAPRRVKDVEGSK